MKHWIVLIALFLDVYVEALHAKDDSYFFPSGSIAGKRVVTRISEDALKDAPEWDPRKEDTPPLTQRQVLLVAQAKLDSLVKLGRTDRNWVLKEIKLTRSGFRFLYFVTFERDMVFTGDHPDLVFVVTLGGTVLPFQEPENSSRRSKKASDTGKRK